MGIQKDQSNRRIWSTKHFYIFFFERRKQMLAKKTILGITVVAVIGLVLASQSLSQPGQRGQRGGPQGQQGQRGQRGGFGGRQFDPEQMRQRMEQRLREQLGATEQEWKVLGPRVLKVQELSRQVEGRGGMFGAFGRRGGFGGRGGRPGGPGGDRPGAPQRELTAVERAQEQLRTVLDNSESTPEQIKAQLTALRTAKEKTKQELAAAQQELRKIITIRQEAILVMMGTLD
jgi:hypothetical protein